MPIKITEEHVKLFSKHDCRKCYGRGFLGYKLTIDNKRILIVCRCVTPERVREIADKMKGQPNSEEVQKVADQVTSKRIVYNKK